MGRDPEEIEREFEEAARRAITLCGEDVAAAFAVNQLLELWKQIRAFGLGEFVIVDPDED